MSQQSLKQAVTGNGGKKPETFPAMIDQLKKQVALALPKHLNADRMARIGLTEFNKNRQLGECEPRSVFASIIIASQLGLEPGIMGQGYLIPYKDRRQNKMICQFIPGWQGLVDLAQRSGRASIWTGAVFEGDEFEYDFGSSPQIHHKPCGEDDPKAMQYVWSVGRIRGAEYPIIDVWPTAKVWRHRDRFNKVGDRHYSFEHPEMYARKIPLLQVLKYMPKSAELSLAVDLEHAGAAGLQRPDIKDAIDGTFSVAPDQDDNTGQNGAAAGASTGSEHIPIFSKETALEALRSAGKVAGIDKAYTDIKADFSASKRELPVDVEAVYHEQREALAEREAQQAE